MRHVPPQGFSFLVRRAKQGSTVAEHESYDGHHGSFGDDVAVVTGNFVKG